MNYSISDAKLDAYISTIKESEQITEKMSAYKKANRRLHVLQNEHVELCNMLKKVKKSKKDASNKASIDDLLEELTDIDNAMNDDAECMKTLIEKYIQHKTLLNNLEIEADNMRNEIMKVEESGKRIIVQKLDVNDIF